MTIKGSSSSGLTSKNNKRSLSILIVNDNEKDLSDLRKSKLSKHHLTPLTATTPSVAVWGKDNHRILIGTPNGLSHFENVDEPSSVDELEKHGEQLIDGTWLLDKSPVCGEEKDDYHENKNNIKDGNEDIVASKDDINRKKQPNTIAITTTITPKEKKRIIRNKTKEGSPDKQLDKSNASIEKMSKIQRTSVIFETMNLPLLITHDGFKEQKRVAFLEVKPSMLEGYQESEDGKLIIKTNINIRNLNWKLLVDPKEEMLETTANSSTNGGSMFFTNTDFSLTPSIISIPRSPVERLISASSSPSHQSFLLSPLNKQHQPAPPPEIIKKKERYENDSEENGADDDNKVEDEIPIEEENEKTNVGYNDYGHSKEDERNDSGTEVEDKSMEDYHDADDDEYDDVDNDEINDESNDPNDETNENNTNILGNSTYNIDNIDGNNGNLKSKPVLNLLKPYSINLPDEEEIERVILKASLVRILKKNAGNQDSTDSHLSDDDYDPIIPRLKSDARIWALSLRKKKGFYYCPHCHCKYQNIAGYAKHLDEFRINRPMVCTEIDCPWSIVGFSKRGEWLRHTRSLHSKESYPCPVCHRAFIRKDGMKRHIFLCHKSVDLSEEEIYVNGNNEEEEVKDSQETSSESEKKLTEALTKSVKAVTDADKPRSKVKKIKSDSSQNFIIPQSTKKIFYSEDRKEEVKVVAAKG